MLSAQRRVLFAKLLKKRNSTPFNGLSLVSPRERAEDFPLSFAQEGLWFLEKLAPGAATYNVSLSVLLRGHLDHAALQQALGEVVRRHESLRTHFVSLDGGPRQVIDPAAEVPLPLVDLSWVTAETREAELRMRLQQESSKGFDLSRGPLMRTQLLRLAHEEHVLVMTMHHIIFDGWSSAILVSELGNFYQGLAAGTVVRMPELPIQYADFAQWQRESLQRERLGRRLEYWKERLADLPVLALPSDRERPALPSYRGAAEAIRFDQELRNRLEQLAKREGDTLFMVLLAVFLVLLHRYSGQDDIVLGSPVANRTTTQVENLIGFFANTLVLRADLARCISFLDVLACVRQMCLEAEAHQDAPLEKLVEELCQERDPSRNPLFQVTFTWQNSATILPELPNLNIEVLAPHSGACKFDLSLLLSPGRNGGLSGIIEYASDLFEPATIQRMIRHYERLMRNVSMHPETPIRLLPMLDEHERQEVQVEWPLSKCEYPENRTVQELFEEQAAARADSIAVTQEGRKLPFGELNRRANQLAHYLRAQGMEPETRVALMMDRSLEAVVSMLAILKSGGVYVPLDPSYPAERLSFMLEDSAVPLLVTQRDLRDRLPLSWARVITLDEEHTEIARMEQGNPPTLVSPDNAAYVMYTSGSTGTPKGIEVIHRGIVRLVRNSNYVSVMPGDQVAQVANMSFDAATFEVWGALLNAATVAIIPRAVTLSPAVFSLFLKAQRIDVMFLTTALFNLVVGEDPQAFSQVRDLLVGGEASNPHFVRKALDQAPPQRLVNIYGPTENTTFTSFHEVKSLDANAQSVPIGRPIHNTSTYVLNSELEPAPAGVTGELYIGGAGLARGYLKRPALTAEHFVPNPFELPGERLYRTGDLVRWRPDGELEFIGRNDSQVKIRGFRIELGEIEAILHAHPGVRQAAVMVREHEPGRKELVAYVACDNNLAEQQLREALLRRLPEYMVPAHFVTLAALPLTPNGKLDRRALPGLEDHEAIDAKQAALRTPTEELLAEIWKDVLCHDRIDANDDFFALGGHSLMATQVISRLRVAFGLEMELQLIFQFPLLHELAKNIDRLMGAGPALAPPINKIDRSQPLPLSFAQQRMWFVEQLAPGSPAYTIPVVVRIRGSLNQSALARALDTLVHRHESLRTCFEIESGVVTCRAVEIPAAASIVTIEDCRDIPQVQREELARQACDQEAATGFDLCRAPLIRVRLIQMENAEHLLLLTMHHIVSDSWSIGVLIREVSGSYEAFRDGKDRSLPEMVIQYADFAAWQREWLSGEVLDRQLQYWKECLADAPILDLAMSRRRPAILGHHGFSKRLHLSASLTGRLRQLARKESTTLFMVLLAAFQVLLSRWSGQDDITVGTPVANRTRREIEELIGFFVNTLVLRADLSGDLSFRELLARTRKSCLAAYAHQDLPFERLVGMLRPHRDLARTPLFQVLFALQNAADIRPHLGDGLQCELVTRETNYVKYEMDCSLQEVGDCIHGVMVFNSDLFDENSAQQMVESYERLLESVVTDPAQNISSLQMITESGRQLLESWSSIAVEHQNGICVHDLIRRQVQQTPDALAVSCHDQSLTYAGLLDTSGRLARHLRRLGVRPEVRVGICLERSIDMVSAIIGVLMAGGAYVPLDPTYPNDRLEFILEDSRAEVLVTKRSLLDRFPSYQATVFAADDQSNRAEELSSPIPEAESVPANLAYVIYTSGSTGRPKGVAIQHASAVAMLAWAQRVFDRSELRCVLASTSICFDLSVFEIFAPLAVGGEVIVARNLLETPQIPGCERLTLLNTVPSAMAELLRMKKVPRSVRVVNLAGEALPAELVEEIYSLGTVEKVFNLYGPSEDTTYSTWAWVEKSSQLPPIGRPVDNSQMHVMGRAMEILPPGCTGELYIGGAGLARGYWARPSLTADRFVPDPFSGMADTRLYRTGDLVRWNFDGLLEYLGRVDDQVKIRGLRIEPAEIDSWLRKWGGIRESATVPRETRQGKQLVTYIVAHEAQNPPSPEQMRTYLLAQLPEYMVPATFVPLATLPRTRTGKLDRERLPDPEQFAKPTYQQARTETEEKLTLIWQELLGLEQVGIDDNFFALGGHSLLLLRLNSEIKEFLNQELSMVEMFGHPTIRSLAAKLSADPSQSAAAHRTDVAERLLQGRDRLMRLRTRSSQTVAEVQSGV